MTKLERLAVACKGAVTLEANPHRDVYYKSASEWFEHGVERHGPEDEGPPPEELAEIEAGATLWWLQWYPRTPNGFNRLFGSNLERMLDEALKDMGVTDAPAAQGQGSPGPTSPDESLEDWIERTRQQRAFPLSPRR